MVDMQGKYMLCVFGVNKKQRRTSWNEKQKYTESTAFVLLPKHPYERLLVHLPGEGYQT